MDMADIAVSRSLHRSHAPNIADFDYNLAELQSMLQGCISAIGSAARLLRLSKLNFILNGIILI